MVGGGSGQIGHVRDFPELSFVPPVGREVKRAKALIEGKQVQAGAEAAGDARAPSTLPNSPGLAIWLFYPAKLEQGMA